MPKRGFQQQRRCLKMAIVCRLHERRCLLHVRLIDVRASREQPVHDFGTAFTCSLKQRCRAESVACLYRGARLQQALDSSFIAGPRRIEQLQIEFAGVKRLIRSYGTREGKHEWQDPE